MAARVEPRYLRIARTETDGEVRAPVETAETTADYTFSRTGLRHALRELDIQHREGPKEFVMQCFFDPSCESGKKSLYLVHRPRDGSASRGMYHCFKCGAKGLFYTFVAAATGWNTFKVSQFLRKHRATGAEVEEEAPEPIELSKDRLAQYAFRHSYCYERGLSEETLRRYKIGYDKEQNEIIFPWFDRVGKLIAIKRRAVIDKYYRFEGEGTSLTRLLFGLHLVRQRGVVWITEGEFDAMFLDQVFREYKIEGHYAVALGGKYLHAQALQELLHKAPNLIVLALDGDQDGSAAADVIANLLVGVVPTYRLTYEQGVKDPNDSTAVHILEQHNHITKQLQTLTHASEQRLAAWKAQQTA
jgi:DNA primase